MTDQLVYYGIYNGFHRMMRPGSVDARYGCNKGNDVDDRVIVADLSFDPLEILPPELSLRCLLDAINSGGVYRRGRSELLQMLNVSKKWRQYMVSAPLLWSGIHIDCSTPDLLATVATFIHLSSAAPLEVVIWGDPGALWSEIGTILLPHSQRIHRLCFRVVGYTDPRTLKTMHISWAKRVLGSFHCLAGLKELDFSVEVYSSDADLPTIPHGVLVQSTLHILPLKTDLPVASLENYVNVTTCNCLDDIIPLLGSLPVRDLYLYGDGVIQMSTSNDKIPLEAFSHLKRLTYSQPYCISLVKLVSITAHQLSSLQLSVPHSNIQEIINALSMLVKLKHLQLFLVQGTTETDRASHPSCGAVIHGLDTLMIDGPGEQALYPLFTAFVTMYPSVRDVTIALSSFSPICAAYLASLAYIETLYYGCGTDTTLQPSIHLPSLQFLSAKSHHILQYFKVPNLLNLDLIFPQDSTRFDMVSLPCLRKLIIRQSSGLDLHLKPSDYPELRTLTIFYRNLQWKLSSLPQLISITLDSYMPDRHSGTLLCAALLYRPEYCPALQQISFSQPVEWDILFLMLERRNQATEYVKRIDEISLPFVPFILRKPFGLLLKGRSAERPSNLELSFEGARELVYDSTIAGCSWCLRHMRPDCTELGMPRKGLGPLEFGNCLVDYPEPPADVPTDIRDWLFQYRRLREEWKHLRISRIEFCRFWHINREY